MRPGNGRGITRRPQQPSYLSAHGCVQVQSVATEMQGQCTMGEGRVGGRAGGWMKDGWWMMKEGEMGACIDRQMNDA